MFTSKWRIGCGLAWALCLLLWPAFSGTAGVIALADSAALEPVVLAEALAAPQAAAHRQLDVTTLADVRWERGRARLDGAAALELRLNKPISAAGLGVALPDPETILELAVYLGDERVGSELFSERHAEGSVLQPIRDGRIALESEQPFDRLRLRRLDTPPRSLPMYVDTLWLGDTPSAKGDSGSLAVTACQAALGVAHNIAFGAALVPGVGAAANRTAYLSNLALKFCPPVFAAPPDRTIRVPAGTCEVAFAQPRMQYAYENALGVAYNYESDWGELGAPFLFHHNTEVDVMLLYKTPQPPQASSLDLDFLLRSGSLEATDRIWQACNDAGTVRNSQLEGDNRVFECPYVRDRELRVPVGRNSLRWRANVRVGPVDLLSILIPGAPAGAKFDPYAALLLNVVREFFTIAFDDQLSGWRTANEVDVLQTVTVPDEVAPTITPMAFDDGRVRAELVGGELRVRIEADEAGGVSQRRYEPLLRALYQVNDACDRKVAFSASYPSEALRSFWPVNPAAGGKDFEITWTASDPGPNLAGQSNQTVTRMQVEVVDTRAPVIVPPDDIVEVDSTAVTQLGQPLVFDFVDLAPQVSNDAVLPLGPGLHEVTWTVTDASGNSDSAVQLVNIKASNSAPAAIAQAGAQRAAAVSFEPTRLRLRGSDADGDPLRFHIEQAPENGFFVAPLYPYFVEDLRIEQSLSDAELLSICTNGEGNDRDFDLPFPSQPEYLTATDDGRSFVVDRGRIDCRAGSPVTVRRLGRLAVFGADGSLLAARQAAVDNLRDLIVDSARDRLYFTETNSGRTTSVRVYDGSLQPQVTFSLSNVRDRATGTCLTLYPSDGCTIFQGTSAIVDGNDVLYVMRDNGFVFSFDARLPEDFDCSVSCTHTPTWIGNLTDDGLGTPGDGHSLGIDSQGRLYASRRSRIYRWQASGVDADSGLAFPGPLDGWLGRCDSDLAAGDQAVCDVANRRSLGFACTDAVCGVSSTFNASEQAQCDSGVVQNPNHGCRPGQFRGARGFDLDAGGTLYIADSGNRRIQRFTPEGFFSGQARSSCDGGCFILGDFGSPQDVAANATRFHVLDPATNLLHISLTSPFVEFGPDFADVIYQSDNGFACANSADCIDAFAFSVSDGVRDPASGRPQRSAPASVEVEVSRNFRPPVATPALAAAGVEDQALTILLDGSDPDPLDALNFSLTEAPAQGSVQIIGNQAIYTPTPDFWGEDSFRFRASDGSALSAPETVTVTLLEVNDPPVLLPPAELADAGVGFRYALDWEFVDVDPDELLTVSINWGDGSVESEGRIGADGAPSGPLLFHAGDGAGLVSASHVYTTAGTRTLQVCLTDRMQANGENKLPTPGLSLTACSSRSIEVRAGLDVEISGAASPASVRPGQFFNYQIELRNRPPDAGPGSNASGVMLALELPLGLDLPATGVPAGCIRQQRDVQCDVGTLAIGQQASLGFSLRVASDTPTGSLLSGSARMSLEQSDISPDNRLLISTPVTSPADFQVGIDDLALADAGDATPGDGACASSSGACTLRAAVEEAQAQGGPKAIALPHGHYLLEDTLAISGDLTLLGSGPHNTQIQRISAGRTLLVENSARLRLEGATVSGGGILSNGELILRRVRMTGNLVNNFFGAALLSSGRIDIRDSTFDGNRSLVTSGAGQEGGAIFAINGEGVLENVTFSGNIGGALGLAGSGSYALRHLTITGNQGGSGWEAPAGSLNVYDGVSATLANSVVAGNQSVGGPRNCYVSGSASLVSEGNNAFGDLSGCGVQSALTDRSIEDAGMPPISDGRIGLPVRVPRGDSALVDAFDDASCLDADALGVSRPRDGDGDGVARCDIGAVEVQAERIFASGFEG